MIDNLKDAISHCKEVAEMNRKEAEELREYGEHVSPPNQPYNIPVKACLECANEHEQLASWLTELAERREADKWTSVKEGLPEEKKDANTNDFAEVLCTTIFGGVRLYKYGTRIGDKQAHFWYGYGIFDSEIIAWKPKPEPYKESEDLKEKTNNDT